MSILTEKPFYPASPVSNGSRAVVTEENYPPTLTLILTLILTLSGRQFSSGGNVRTPFPICLFLTYVVCCEEINSEITSFNFSERSFDIIFRSIFNKKIVLQFLYESFISNFFFNYLNDFMSLRCTDCPFSLVSLTKSTKISFSSFQICFVKFFS